jgi:ribosomal 50S subunit-recycling heat shock protein
MRIDLVLKYLCLVKSRSIAKALCDGGRVLVDGKAARPSVNVAEGAHVTVVFRRRAVTVELVQVPRKQLSKTAAVDYYRPVDTPDSDSPPEAREPLDGDLEVDLDDFVDPR